MEGAGAFVSTADARLWEMVAQAARDVTDEITGRFNHKEHIDAIRTRLTDDDLAPHVQDVSLDRLARSLATGFVSRRTPKPGKPEGMFHPEAVLPLGKGKRIWMDYAVEGDLIAWGLLSSQNLARVARAEGSRQQYVAERLEAFADHRGWNLGRIEREVFGYVDTDDEPDYSDPEWDEDE